MASDIKNESKHQATPDTRPYWDALEQRKLLLHRCRNCGKAHHYPRAHCPFCFGGNLDWEQASGRGTVYSYSVMHRADPPYVMAYIELEEGPVVMSNIVGTPFDKIRIGAPVTVDFIANPGTGSTMAVFKQTD
jgi:uncharacterized OB-fold protein